MRNSWLLLGFCAVHTVMIAVLFNSGLYDHRYSASALYFDYANRVFDGLVPYRDFAVEYPPLALVFFLLPRVFTTSVTAYGAFFTGEIVVFDLIGLYLVSGVARHFRFSEAGSLGICTIGLLAVGPIVGLRFDLIPAIMMLAALYAFYRGHGKTTWAMLALSTMTKLYPAVVVPLFVLHHVLRREYRRLVVGCITFGVVCLLCAYPFWVLARGGFIGSFLYQTERGLQVESTYGSILLFVQNLGLMPLYLDFASGGWNVGGPLADGLSRLSTPIVVLTLALVYCFYARQQRRLRMSPAAGPPDYGLVTNCSVAAVIVFMVARKVLSPQFVVWLYPLMPLLAGRWRYTAWALFVIIGLQTYYLFPTHYIDVLQFEAVPVGVLLWRNLCLIALGVTLLKAASLPEAGPDEGG